MNINKLEELAKAVTGWSNCDKAWLDTSEDTPAAVFGHIDEDGNTYPVATVDCDQYYSGDSLNLAKFYAATNPSAILELITAYREAVAALSDPALYCSDTTYCDEFCCREKQRNALDTAKRLGVE